MAATFPTPRRSRIRTQHVLTALALAATPACGLVWHRTRPAAPREPSAAVLRTLLTTDAARAESVAGRSWADRLTTRFSADVVYLAAGWPAQYGLDAARAVFMGRANGTPAVAWQPLGGGVSVDGSSGYTYGVRAVATADSASVPQVALDRYLAFWRHGSDGWRIVAYAEVNAPSPAVATATVTTPPADARTGRVNAAVERMRQSDAEFSLLADRSGAAKAFGDYAAPDAVIFSGSELVVGPAAIRNRLAADVATGTLTWTPVLAEVAGSGDLGFTIGERVFTGRSASGAAAQQYGKYLMVWRRQPGGVWKFVADGSSPSPAPRAP